MLSYVLAMSVVLAVAVAVLGIVVVGLQGRGKEYAPRMADRLERAAHHLNGDAEPPQRFTKLFH